MGQSIDVNGRDCCDKQFLELVVKTLGFGESAEVVLVSFSGFVASAGIHASVVGNVWAFRKSVFVSCASESDVVSVRHEEAEMAIVTASEWTLNGSCIVIKFDLEFADCDRRGPHIGIQWRERVVR